MITIKPHQSAFINFLITSGALTFGDFLTKSGRKTPYFINTGNFNSGSAISKLGTYYAAHLVVNNLQGVNTIFGPAYKGIPLCVATASALHEGHGINLGFTFDRKEEKDHGDGGLLVGYQVKPHDKVILVEDVVTAGTTLRKIVPFIREKLNAEVSAVVISVDRCERGTGSLSAVQEAEQSLGIKVYPLVTIHHILQYLSSDNSSGVTLDRELQLRIESYLEQYGA